MTLSVVGEVIGVGDISRGGQVGGWGPLPIAYPSPEVPVALSSVQSCRSTAKAGTSATAVTGASGPLSRDDDLIGGKSDTQ